MLKKIAKEIGADLKMLAVGAYTDSRDNLRDNLRMLFKALPTIAAVVCVGALVIGFLSAFPEIVAAGIFLLIAWIVLGFIGAGLGIRQD